MILVHGIRTRAEWQTRIRNLFEADGTTKVVPIGYGYFDAFRFWSPVLTRQGPVRVVLSKIRDALSTTKLTAAGVDLNSCEIVFVGHSFGTYILGQILKENPDIRPHRLLLCGSIIPEDFRWDQLSNRPQEVLNEAGSRDIWPILAKALTWGYGSSGTFGFMGYVRDRYHNIGHSDYFEPGFAEKFWVPWIQTGKVESTEFETELRPSTPWFKNLIEVLPIKSLVLAAAVAAWWMWFSK